MKKSLLLATVFFLGLAVTAQNKVDDVVKFNTTKHDFGKLKQNVPANYSFEITNISDKPVVVENTSASCGCTTPEKIVKPIMPGETAKLKVQYNAASPTPFTKEVKVKLAGIDEIKTVYITGEVLTADAYDNWVKTKGNK